MKKTTKQIINLVNVSVEHNNLQHLIVEHYEVLPLEIIKAFNNLSLAIKDLVNEN